MTAVCAAGAHIHVVRFAPAKLNLTLAVTGRRSDGYHSLHSVMVPLSLGDALTVSTAPPSAGRDTLRVTGLGLTATPDNLVIKAIAAVRAAIAETWPGAPAVPPPLAARLAKRIPVAAGLGGGSSDAAATIAAALAAWSTGLSPEATNALAASLGSDVPFFLAGAAALVTGRGEFVEPLTDIEGAPQSGEAPAVLLVTPQLPVATAAVFKAYAGGARPDGSAALEISERLVEAMRAGMGAADLQAKLPELARANDLMLAAASIAPGLKAFIAALEKAIGRPVCQSGSGPTLWSLYPTLAEARRAVRLVRLSAVNGRLPLVGSGEPFVAATTIAGRSISPSVSLPESTVGTIRPRTVHNGFDGGAHGPDKPVRRHTNSNGEEPR
jgi:4-diphosphocytidyl-2-C-methyl-D-erythritol kinase